VKLDEKAFPEMVARDLWLPLDTGGRLLLRLSREREKDDAQFYFGKAFRRLKLIEGEMVRNCADKVRHGHPTVSQRVSSRALFADDTLHTGVSFTKASQEALPRFYRSYDAYIHK